MATTDSWSSSRDISHRNNRDSVVIGVLCAIWYPVRLILFSVLALFEPVVRIGLSLAFVGGFFAWIVFKVLWGSPNFPTATILGISVGCAVLLVLYYVLMRALRP